MTYKITHSLEAQNHKEVGMDIYIGDDKTDVITIRIRSNIENDAHFIRFTAGLERLINQYLRKLNNC